MKKTVIWFSVWFILFMGAYHVFAAQSPLQSLSVGHNSGMQPFGIGYEDEITAESIIQPTYLGVQVTENGMFLQGSSNE